MIPLLLSVLMRYATLLVAAVALLGCSTTDHVAENRSTIAFDFSKYSEKGFLITPQSYRGEYTSIGQISTVVSPEATKARSPQSARRRARDEPGAYAKGIWVVYGYQPGELVQTMYQKADSMGADAIVNWQVTPRTVRVDPTLSITEWRIRGFAIDREGN